MHYCALAKKAQLYREQVTYLGYILKDGKRWLLEARKGTVLKIPTPTNVRQIKEFLVSPGFCRLWIPAFVELARLLYEATKGSQELQWTQAQQEAFESLKQSLLIASALGLPDVTKPFHLYENENKGIAKGVLTQTFGPWCARLPICLRN